MKTKTFCIVLLTVLLLSLFSGCDEQQMAVQRKNEITRKTGLVREYVVYSQTGVKLLEFSGLSYITDGSVNGNVTVYLVNEMLKIDIIGNAIVFAVEKPAAVEKLPELY